MLLASYSTNSLPSVFNGSSDSREVDGNTSSTPSTPSTPYHMNYVQLNTNHSVILSPTFEISRLPPTSSPSAAKPKKLYLPSSLKQLVLTEPNTTDNNNNNQTICDTAHSNVQNVGSNSTVTMYSHHPQSSSQSKLTGIKSRNLHVDNLPPITEEQLREYFSSYGPVLRVRIAAHSIVYTDADYGFVMFEKTEDAKRALIEADGVTLPLSMCNNAEDENLFLEKKLRVTIARPKRKFLDLRTNTNLYIANLPLDFTHARLMDVFSKFGSILESRILMERDTGKSRGVGFVRFENTRACDRAIQAFHNKIPSFATVPLTVRYAVDKPIHNYPQQMLMNYNSPSSHYPTSVNTLSTFAAMISANGNPLTNPPQSPTNLLGTMDFNTSLAMLQYSSNIMSQQYPYIQSMFIPSSIPTLSLSSPMSATDYNAYSPSHSM
jgi:RNA recognition motif-containing protein